MSEDNEIDLEKVNEAARRGAKLPPIEPPAEGAVTDPLEQAARRGARLPEQSPKDKQHEQG